MRRTGLGRGIDALLKDNDIQTENENEKDAVEVRVSEIEPNVNQPRRTFDEDKLQELAQSIKQHGLIQPLVVRKIDDGRYQIIAGERRWRASRIAGIEKLPVIIRDYGEKEVMEIALVENLQREDLNIIEQAKGYKALMEEYSLTQETVAERVGKSRPVIANALRMLNLPEKTIELVEQNEISSGQAKVLLSAENCDIDEIAQLAAEKKMTVRQLEDYIKKLNKEKKGGTGKPEGKSIFEIEAELMSKNLGEKFSTKVNIINGKKKGKIEIEFYSEEQLNQILDKMAEI